MPVCRVCGRSDPRTMIGLTTFFFGPVAELPAESGYFYLCPTCFADRVGPHLGALLERLAHLHPSPGHQPDGDPASGPPTGPEATPPAGPEACPPADPEAGPPAGPGADGPADPRD
jgi:hypothetical protein